MVLCSYFLQASKFGTYMNQNVIKPTKEKVLNIWSPWLPAYNVLIPLGENKFGKGVE